MRSLDWQEFLKKRLPYNTARSLEDKVNEEIGHTKIMWLAYGLILGMIMIFSFVRR